MFTPFRVTGCSLELLNPGEQGIVTFYQTQDKKILEEITSIGITIGICITLEQKFPALVIKVDSHTISINQQIARNIYVRIVEH
ncbi:FeoA domain-containing protein [Nostoc sp. LEGE 06077]|uniref:FeoA domain-containing protein n=1 Tax=Nostoc sp. LEGE 06077 TaxID=915325 RepID=UPI00187FD1D6|nr:FeoA domain-containing protein [Nostoc sp. LEGE 06077]MBE9205853.1 FeoA domain-containing protein [Nostoc sp. LEGE 06077]